MFFSGFACFGFEILFEKRGNWANSVAETWCFVCSLVVLFGFLVFFVSWPVGVFSIRDGSFFFQKMMGSFLT